MSLEQPQINLQKRIEGHSLGKRGTYENIFDRDKQVKQVVYDPEGKIVEVIEFFYDQHGRLTLETIKGAKDNVVSWEETEYDEKGHRIRSLLIDDLFGTKREIRYFYTEKGKLKEVTDTGNKLIETEEEMVGYTQHLHRKIDNIQKEEK